MPRPLRRIGTVLKYGTIHRVIDLGRLIPVSRTKATANTIQSLLNSVAPLRRRVEKNMELALGPGNVPANASADYFHKLGMWISHAGQMYHRGVVDSGLLDWMVFDDSEVILEEALSRGKGVIFAVPHLIAHELTAAIMARKYPTVGLVRESKYEPHMRVKMHYYNTAGQCKVILRPRRGNVASDMRVCTRTLKEGNILVITPDLLTGPSDGVKVNLLGHGVNLRPGIVSLSMVTGAPVVSAFLQWEDDRVLIHCLETEEYSRAGDRARTMTSGMQHWCDLFSEHLRQFPGSWQFWLDRHWSGVWQRRAGDGAK